jgi:glutaredoxin-like protein NrdH
MAPKIKLFTLSTCSHCKAAKRFLNDGGFSYEFTDVDLLRSPEKETILKEVAKHNPERSFPTIIIGSKVIVGFRENDIREALGI